MNHRMQLPASLHAVEDGACNPCVAAAALALAAQQAAKEEGLEGATPEDGPWLFTLDFPLYAPVMAHAKSR
jgi:Zn-dependent oligopeptidase